MFTHENPPFRTKKEKMTAGRKNIADFESFCPKHMGGQACFVPA